MMQYDFLYNLEPFAWHYHIRHEKTYWQYEELLLYWATMGGKVCAADRNCLPSYA